MSSAEFSEFAEALAEETRRAMAKDDLDAAMPLVVQVAIDTGLADFAGVTQRVDNGRFESVGVTDDLVQKADLLQYQLQEGPCVRASYVDGNLFSAEVATDPRWPRWGPAAQALGIGSVLSVHLYTDRIAMGALNLYSIERREYSAHELSLAQLIGAHASVALAHFRGEENLWRAIDSRHQIGVAQGILRHQYKVTAEQALALLTRVSQRRNVKVHLLAGEVIRSNDGAVLIGPDPE
ncbi:ANTAR domain-containing protein [Nakamurella silvestris]|nr:ANTAR domain-containing protein [Nakamurella silvestris]